MIKGKIWGSTELILDTPLIQVHLLNVYPRARCSEHVHRFKWNAFFLLEGDVYIRVTKLYDLIEVTRLRKYELTSVPPGEEHYFETLDDPCKMLEIYYPEPLSEDIVRSVVGRIG